MDLAFLGMGTMGAAMARNLINAGHKLTVWNRTASRCQPLVELGAQAAETPARAAAAAEITFICVSDTPDVRQVVLGEDGVIQGARPGSLVVDMSTISPQATREIGAALAEKQIAMLDAPVSGGSEGAQKATLTIMVGGEEKDLKRAMPALEAMGKSITLMGPLGSGQATKAVNQTIICGIYWGVAEGIALGLKAGLDMDKVVQALRGGVCGSWILENRSGNMIKNQYPLGFKVTLHKKDLGIALDTAAQLGVFLPVASLVDQAYNSLIAKGHGDEDMSALARIIREQSGLD